MSERTEHGFRTGPIEVDALIEGGPRSVVGVSIGRDALAHPKTFDIQSSPAGRKVEIVLPDIGERWQSITILLPNGASVRVQGTGRWGWAASMFDKDGHYAGGWLRADGTRMDES